MSILTRSRARARILGAATVAATAAVAGLASAQTATTPGVEAPPAGPKPQTEKPPTPATSAPATPASTAATQEPPASTTPRGAAKSPAAPPVTESPTSKESDALDADSTRTAEPEKAATPLPEPRADAQEPGPFTGERGEVFDSRLELGASVGYVSRSADGRDNSYTDGPRAVGYARVHVWRFLHAVAGAGWESHAVELKRQPGVTQADLQGTTFRFALEPSLSWGPVRGWLSLGVGWVRFTADAVTGPNAGKASRRAGVLVEYPLGIGLSYEVVPRWMRLGLSGGLALPTNQTGSLFTRDSDGGSVTTQTIDRDGQLTSAPGLAPFGVSGFAALSAGVLL